MDFLVKKKKRKYYINFMQKIRSNVIVHGITRIVRTAESIRKFYIAK